MTGLMTIVKANNNTDLAEDIYKIPKLPEEVDVYRKISKMLTAFEIIKKDSASIVYLKVYEKMNCLIDYILQYNDIVKEIQSAALFYNNKMSQERERMENTSNINVKLKFYEVIREMTKDINQELDDLNSSETVVKSVEVKEPVMDIESSVMDMESPTSHDEDTAMEVDADHISDTQNETQNETQNDTQVPSKNKIMKTNRLLQELTDDKRNLPPQMSKRKKSLNTKLKTEKVNNTSRKQVANKYSKIKPSKIKASKFKKSLHMSGNDNKTRRVGGRKKRTLKKQRKTNKYKNSRKKNNV